MPTSSEALGLFRKHNHGLPTLTAFRSPEIPLNLPFKGPMVLPTVTVCDVAQLPCYAKRQDDHTVSNRSARPSSAFKILPPINHRFSTSPYPEPLPPPGSETDLRETIYGLTPREQLKSPAPSVQSEYQVWKEDQYDAALQCAFRDSVDSRECGSLEYIQEPLPWSSCGLYVQPKSDQHYRYLNPNPVSNLDSNIETHIVVGKKCLDESNPPDHSLSIGKAMIVGQKCLKETMDVSSFAAVTPREDSLPQGNKHSDMSTVMVMTEEVLIQPVEKQWCQADAVPPPVYMAGEIHVDGQPLESGFCGDGISEDSKPFSYMFYAPDTPAPFVEFAKVPPITGPKPGPAQGEGEGDNTKAVTGSNIAAEEKTQDQTELDEIRTEIQKAIQAGTQGMTHPGDGPEGTRAPSYNSMYPSRGSRVYQPLWMPLEAMNDLIGRRSPDPKNNFLSVHTYDTSQGRHQWKLEPAVGEPLVPPCSVVNLQNNLDSSHTGRGVYAGIRAGVGAVPKQLVKARPRRCLLNMSLRHGPRLDLRNALGVSGSQVKEPTVPIADSWSHLVKEMSNQLTALPEDSKRHRVQDLTKEQTASSVDSESHLLNDLKKTKPEITSVETTDEALLSAASKWQHKADSPAKAESSGQQGDLQGKFLSDDEVVLLMESGDLTVQDAIEVSKLKTILEESEDDGRTGEGRKLQQSDTTRSESQGRSVVVPRLNLKKLSSSYDKSRKPCLRTRAASKGAATKHQASNASKLLEVHPETESESEEVIDHCYWKFDDDVSDASSMHGILSLNSPLLGESKEPSKLLQALNCLSIPSVHESPPVPSVLTKDTVIPPQFEERDICQITSFKCEANRKKEDETAFLKRLSLKVMRNRRRPPGTFPDKMCLARGLSGLTHSLLRDELEAQGEVKVKLIEYDPVYLRGFTPAEVRTCRWIFELEKDANPDLLLTKGLRLLGSCVDVRYLSDQLKDEYINYLKYATVSHYQGVRQEKKRKRKYKREKNEKIEN